MLAPFERADAFVGLPENGGKVFVETAIGEGAPGIGDDGQIIEPGIVTRVVVVDGTGDGVALKEDVIGEEIGVNHPAGQLIAGPLLLRFPFIGKQLSFGRAQLGEQPSAGFLAPAEPGGVRMLLGKAATSEMHACEQLPEGVDLGLVGHAALDGLPGQALHDGGRFTAESTEDLASARMHWRRAGNAVLTQPLRNVQVIRDALSRQTFKNGQNEAAALGIEKKVAVLGTRADAGNLFQAAKVIGGQKACQLGIGEFGVDSHAFTSGRESTAGHPFFPHRNWVHG